VDTEGQVDRFYKKLQVRQEELRQTNEELKEQARTLEYQKQELEKKNTELKKAHELIEEKAKDLEIPQRLWRNLQKGEEVYINNRVIKPSDVLGSQRPGRKMILYLCWDC
jgi:peptidoglycan hydrolase CwlO-like protein